MTIRRSADVTGFDPLKGRAAGTGLGVLGSIQWLSRLVRVKPSLGERAAVEFVGDLADSWEYSPDRMTLTMKLRSNATWHPIAPVNGRSVEAEDIAVTWERWVELGANAQTYAASLNPNAPIESISAIDASTVEIKLARPVSSVLGLLATNAGGMFVTPKEVVGGYDPNLVAIGSGPWQLENYEPSVKVDLKRHEKFHEADLTYVDQMTEIILPEYATLIAQFRAGNIFSIGTDIVARDILDLHKDLDGTNVYQQDPAPAYTGFNFGWNPDFGDGTPFRDQRLRQAFSMALDRDLYFETFFDLPLLEAAGFPLGTYYHTALQPDTAGQYWLDPRSSDFGANSKYYTYNVEEAKKLMAAAGFPDGVEIRGIYGDYGNAFISSTVPIVEQFLNEVGFDFQMEYLAFATDYAPFHRSQGDFEGFAMAPRGAAGIFDPVEIAFTEFTPSAAIAYSGFFAEGGSFRGGDPAYTDLLTKARQEFDEDTRVSLMQDFQRLEAENQYRPAFFGVADGLGINWAALKNWYLYHAELPFLRVWLDENLPPFK